VRIELVGVWVWSAGLCSALYNTGQQILRGGEPGFLALFVLLLGFNLAMLVRAHRSWQIEKIRASTPELPGWLRFYFLDLRVRAQQEKRAAWKRRLLALIGR
jgi:hypothetical protein